MPTVSDSVPASPGLISPPNVVPPDIYHIVLLEVEFTRCPSVLPIANGTVQGHAYGICPSAGIARLDQSLPNVVPPHIHHKVQLEVEFTRCPSVLPIANGTVQGHAYGMPKCRRCPA